MLQRCPPEEKDNTGNEILRICRSLYETQHMLPVEVSFTLSVMDMSPVSGSQLREGCCHNESSPMES